MIRGNLMNISLFALVLLIPHIEAGVIKDLYNKITNSNSSKSENLVRQSAPICGNSVFSSSDKSSVSPEIILITNRASRAEFVDTGRDREQYGGARDRDRENERESGRRGNDQRGDLSEVAREFRFNVDNVTLQDLERQGFNPEAPVTFLIHGFTSGYPLQAWMSAIVEAYTIDRESDTSQERPNYEGELYQNPARSNYNNRDLIDGTSSRRRTSQNGRRPSNGKQLRHNLFIINWNYAARGLVYPRAVANIPIVASYVTRFINERLLDEARVDPRRIQLIGHSLGAHLAGFIGKNTRSKLGRIYGLDPAGPCFGTISGSLYPSSNRLAPSDAEEVVTIHTNTALLGIDKPLGRYSVFVEGGSAQPGCKDGGVLKSISTLTWDGGDFDTIACSHSRAPNLLTYRHDQTDSDDNCQMIAYECKDWDSFFAGHCGVCRSGEGRAEQESNYGSSDGAREDALKPVECLRVGLDWQYPTREATGTNSGSYNQRETEWQRPTTSSYSGAGNSQYDGSHNDDQRENIPSRRPTNQHSTSGYNNSSYDDTSDYADRSTSTRRPHKSTSGHSTQSSHQKDRETNPNSTETMARRGEDESVKSKSMFLRTSDTQPYCAYHYQIVLELDRPFDDKDPSMSILLQDSETESERARRPLSSGSQSGRGQNSLSSDQFGNKFDDKTYTHLLTSSRKLRKIDHATLIFRDGLPDGQRTLKSLHVNYMSNSDPNIRRKLSSQLCLVRKNVNTGQGREIQDENRFFFEPCTKRLSSDYSDSQSERNTSLRPNKPYNPNY